jgi:hypothetical protein
VTPITAAIITALVTGFVVNWLIHKWQQRNWINQQRYLGAEKEYIILKELADEIAGLAGARLFRMRRLARILRNPDDVLVKKRSEDYDTAQIAWNDKLSSFLVKLRMYTPYRMAVQLEDRVQDRFARIGARLERVTSERLSGNKPSVSNISDLEKTLNKLHGEIIMFNREMLRIVLSRRKMTYSGTRLTLTKETLQFFPTWQLLKALFKRRAEPLSIVRTAADIEPPRN